MSKNENVSSIPATNTPRKPSRTRTSKYGSSGEDITYYSTLLSKKVAVKGSK